MELCRTILTILVHAFLMRFSASVKTHDVFYVLGGDGMYVIDPVNKTTVAKITNITSPGLCTKGNNRRSRSDCVFSGAAVVGDHVFVADASGSSVHVIDVNTQRKQETIPTDPHPYGLHSVPWRDELWVHSWLNSTFDVIHTANRERTHQAIRAHVTPGWTHGIMLADKDMLEGKAAYVTHMWNPGIHKLNLESKSYTKFLHFSKNRCSGTYGIAYNPYNNRLYVECRKGYRSISILELNVDSDTLTKTYNFSGFPFISPNGRHVVVLYRYKSVSRMNILSIKETTVEQYPELRIPGGVSHVVFYPKSQNPESYIAFVTLDYVNKMAVVDLDLAKNGNISDVRYIANVDFLNTAIHGASRELFISGKWILSPASRNNTAVIIDAEKQKIHGKVPNVNGGYLAVWVGALETPTGTPL